MTAAALQQWFDQAIEHHRNGALAEAEALYLRVIESKPDAFDALHMLGVIRHQQGRNDEAHDLIARALSVRPGSVWARSNLGLVLLALGRPAEALAAFDQALAADPNDPQVLNSRGNALQELGRHDEALTNYAAALAREPRYAEAHYNSGAALQALDHLSDAVACYERALTLQPDYADAHWNESLALLSLGDFERGWRKFEWRWRTSDAARRAPLPHPLWLGETPLNGRKIVLHAEQGLGDAIQFVRYVPMVAARGATVFLAVHTELKTLFADVGAAAVYGEGEPLPACDLRCPLLSLPLAFGTTLDTVPAKIPYLRAPAAALAHWKPRLPQAPGLRVGLAWSGSANKQGRQRALALEALSPILSAPDVTFVSLHRRADLAAEDAALLAGRGNVLQFEAPDFGDAAAIIASLDLVISVDTSLAHLAGATGKPVWILLPFSADWRWLRGREDSPWYPTARLFRQPGPGDWTSVMQRVAEELRKFAR